MRRTLSVLVENEFGVLSRISGLFSGRGFNIETLTAAPTQDASYSRLTLVTTGDDKIIEQICKQLNKLVNVIKVTDITGDTCIDREIVLVKVSAKEDYRSEVLRIAEMFDGKIIDATPKYCTIEVTGDEWRIKSFIEMVKPMGIKEMVRSGKVAITRDLQINGIKVN